MDGDLDDATVDRILRRAGELDPRRESDVDATLNALVSAAEEAGLEPSAVRTAIALEALGEPTEAATLDGLVGAEIVTRDVELATSPDAALHLLDEWLVRAHRLRKGRSDADHREWVRRTDLVGRTQRSVGEMVGTAGLKGVDRVTARAVALPDRNGPRTLVRIELDRSPDRLRRLASGGALAGAGVAGTSVTLAGVYLAPIASIGFVAVGAGGVVTWVNGRRRARALEVELDRLTAELSSGQRPRRLRHRARHMARRRR